MLIQNIPQTCPITESIGYLFKNNNGRTLTIPKLIKIWSYPTDNLQLQDGHVLAIYEFRRALRGVCKSISED
ncbi:hypothetical protein DRO61_07895 [Candidatus Bathyarchaeota archaeon]|nr:MAG: hypothetical protein DRO61_07895 [Candidatus Bathyarchaeota archaeon]